MNFIIKIIAFFSAICISQDTTSIARTEGTTNNKTYQIAVWSTVSATCVIVACLVVLLLYSLVKKRRKRKDTRYDIKNSNTK